MEENASKQQSTPTACSTTARKPPAPAGGESVVDSAAARRLVSVPHTPNATIVTNDYRRKMRGSHPAARRHRRRARAAAAAAAVVTAGRTSTPAEPSRSASITTQNENASEQPIAHRTRSSATTTQLLPACLDRLPA